jgi:hypothetical protein
MSDANFDAELDRDNFEKLCGKTGELVELRRKQMLIGAARLLQSNCENNECNFMEVDCPFQTKSIYGFWTCSIEGRPSCWGLTEVQSND